VIINLWKKEFLKPDFRLDQDIGFILGLIKVPLSFFYLEERKILNDEIFKKLNLFGLII